MRGLGGDGLDAGVDGEAEGDDALGGQVGPLLRVVDDLVEELVHGDEVGAAHVPVRLLAVDGEGGRSIDDRAEELGDAGGDVGVDGALGDGGDVGHACPFWTDGWQR